MTFSPDHGHGQLAACMECLTIFSGLQLRETPCHLPGPLAPGGAENLSPPIYPPTTPGGLPLTLATVFQATECPFRKGEVFCLGCAFALLGAGRGF